VTFRFEPSGESRDWRAPVFPPGDEAEFFFPGVKDLKAPDFNQLGEQGVRVRVTGSMRDVAGKTYDVDEHLDVAAWWKVIKDSGQLYPENPTDEAVSELKKIRETFDKVRRLLERH